MNRVFSIHRNHRRGVCLACMFACQEQTTIRRGETEIKQMQTVQFDCGTTKSAEISYDHRAPLLLTPCWHHPAPEQANAKEFNMNGIFPSPVNSATLELTLAFSPPELRKTPLRRYGKGTLCPAASTIISKSMNHVIGIHFVRLRG